MSEFEGQSRPERRFRASEDDIPHAEGRWDSDDRLRPTTNADWSHHETVNPGWRREHSARRSVRRPSRGSALSVPTSVQELPTWLQQGGWKFVAAAGVLLILALILLLWTGRDTGAVTPDDTTIAEPDSGIVTEDSGIAPAGPDTAAIEPPTAAPAAAPAFEVVNTGNLGLFLRDAPDVNSNVLATLPNGTRVEQIGEDVQGANYVWRNVRSTPDGQEGWVAIDFLQPVP